VASGPDSADVIIVGGGVIGCAVAYFLAAEHGVESIIIERDSIGSAASGGAAGELAAAELTEKGGHRPSPTFTRFLQEGISLHANLAPALLEESGVDYLLTPITMLRPAFNDDEAAGMQEELGRLNEAGIEASWVEPESIKARGSWLADDAVGAIFSTELQLESYPFALALAQAAEQHGVQIRTGEVTGLERDGDRVTGVQLGTQVLHAPTVVIANGPWSQHTSEWIGLDIPVIPLRGQIVHLDIPRGAPRPREAIFHNTGYVLPKPSGSLYIGTTIEDVGFDANTTTEARDSILEAVARLAPQIIDLPIKQMTACLRPYSTDDMPIIGAVPGIDGLFIATGHGFKGITLCLVTGKNLAQLMVEGTSDFALDDFSPARLTRT
jgi:glycine/D-amino acid oxidase-like deaminating enzyme